MAAVLRLARRNVTKRTARHVTEVKTIQAKVDLQFIYQILIIMSLARRKVLDLLNELYTVVRSQRFEDLAVIKFDEKPKFYIIGTCFNDRHLVNGTQTINKELKPVYADTLSIAQGWNVIDYQDVVVHLMKREIRQHFDIEQLWAVGPEHDDHVKNQEFDPKLVLFEQSIQQ